MTNAPAPGFFGIHLLFCWLVVVVLSWLLTLLPTALCTSNTESKTKSPRRNAGAFCFLFVVVHFVRNATRDLSIVPHGSHAESTDNAGVFP